MKMKPIHPLSCDKGDIGFAKSSAMILATLSVAGLSANASSDYGPAIWRTACSGHWRSVVGGSWAAWLNMVVVFNNPENGLD